MLSEYAGALIFLCMACGMAGVSLLAAYLISPRIPYAEKDDVYECGFPAFEVNQVPFDVRYYLTAVIFIIFDLELVFLIPWAICYRHLGWTGFFSVIVFLVEFVVIFFYLLKRGAFNWD